MFKDLTVKLDEGYRDELLQRYDVATSYGEMIELLTLAHAVFNAAGLEVNGKILIAMSVRFYITCAVRGTAIPMIAIP